MALYGTHEQTDGQDLHSPAKTSHNKTALLCTMCNFLS